MDIRIPDALLTTIPQLGEASEQSDPMAWVRLTCKPAGWTWYIIEMAELQTDAIFYGYAVGWDETLEYFNQSELEQIAALQNSTLASDATFAPCQLSEV